MPLKMNCQPWKKNFQMRINKYSSYKESKIDWVGKIPSHWKIFRTTDLCYQNKRKNIGTVEKNLLSLSYGNIIEKDFDTAFGLLPASFETYQIVKPGIIILRLTDLQNDKKSVRVGLVKVRGIITSAYLGLVFNRKIHSAFMYYLLHSYDVLKVFYSQGGSMRQSMKFDDFKSIEIIIPPLEEQTAIAEYLDTKTQAIGKKVSLLEKKIGYYQELRKSLINETVTRGLDKNVKLKDNGIELGDYHMISQIPEHWSTHRLDWITTIVRGNTGFGKDELLDNGKYVALQYGKTYQVDEINNTFQYFVNSEFYKQTQIVNFGDTILITTSETIEDLGHSCFYNRDELGLIGGEQIILKPNPGVIFGKYLYYCSKEFRTKLRRNATGLKVYRFNTDDLKQIFIALPPLEEQIQIADYLTNKIFKIDQIIKNIQTQITTLKELRKTLINDVVTGKIKVIND